jgi:hypothetical protein
MNKNKEFKPRDGYPIIRYHDSDTQVLIGDHVEFKLGLLFWKGWQKGRIYYVPGLSKEDGTYEHNRLRMVGIHDSRGRRSGHVAQSASNRLSDNVRFVGRADDSPGTASSDYAFNEDGQ